MTYVLIPGAGGEAAYWQLVAPRLRALGHEVLAPDLPADDDAAGLRAYADVVLEAIGDRTGVTLVGQSMGVYPATMACAEAPVERLLLVCPMIPAPGESPGAWWSASGQIEARRENDRREGRDPDAPFDLHVGFLHDVPADVAETVLAGGGRPQSDTPFGEPWPLRRWPDVPTRVLAGRHDRFFPLPFLRRLARERIGMEPDVIDSGHLPALARPDELVAWLTA